MYYQTSLFYIQYKTNTKRNTKRMKKITTGFSTFLFATQQTIPYAPYWLAEDVSRENDQGKDKSN